MNGAGGWNDLWGSFQLPADHFVNSALTALFTKPPAEPFPALPGTIPVEQKSVHWLSMGAAGRNDLLRSFCTAAGRTAAL